MDISTKVTLLKLAIINWYFHLGILPVTCCWANCGLLNKLRASLLRLWFIAKRGGLRHICEQETWKTCSYNTVISWVTQATMSNNCKQSWSSGVPYCKVIPRWMLEVRVRLAYNFQSLQLLHVSHICGLLRLPLRLSLFRYPLQGHLYASVKQEGKDLSTWTRLR
jgi:hypothetical protein